MSKTIVSAYVCTLCGDAIPVVAVNGKICRPSGWLFPANPKSLNGLCSECRFGKDETPFRIEDFCGVKPR